MDVAAFGEDIVDNNNSAKWRHEDIVAAEEGEECFSCGD